MKKTTNMLTIQAMIAAIYAALTLLLYPISFGAVQLRLSEALTLLPAVYPMSTVGITLGCFIANLVGGGGVLDMVFGTLATALAGWLTSKCRREWLAPLPPVVLNGLIVGAVIAYSTAGEGFAAAFPLIALQVAAGEFLACYVIGYPLLRLFKKKGFLEKWMKL